LYFVGIRYITSGLCVPNPDFVDVVAEKIVFREVVGAAGNNLHFVFDPDLFLGDKLFLEELVQLLLLVARIIGDL
jgi:hypothetical protein